MFASNTRGGSCAGSIDPTTRLLGRRVCESQAAARTPVLVKIFIGKPTFERSTARRPFARDAGMPDFIPSVFLDERRASPCSFITKPVTCRGVHGCLVAIRATPDQALIF